MGAQFIPIGIPTICLNNLVPNLVYKYCQVERWELHTLSDMSIVCNFNELQKWKKHILHYMQGRGNFLYEMSTQLNQLVFLL